MCSTSIVCDFRPQKKRRHEKLSILVIRGSSTRIAAPRGWQRHLANRRRLHGQDAVAAPLISHRRKRRRGAAAVEFAVVAPLFFALIFGIVEFGRLLMVQQILTNASREGARRAIVEGATASEVTDLVDDYLENSSITGATITVSPTPLTSVGFGDPVTVSCSIPFDQVSWLPAPWFAKDVTLAAETVMNGERLE